MITRIRLKNFKAHEDLDLVDIPKIAVIVGQNNTGKSAILQAAGTVRYGLEDNPYFPLGALQELVRDGALSGTVEVYVKGSSSPATLGLKRSGVTSQTQINARFTNSIHYISWMRSPARTFSYDVFVPDVGMAGERTWNILHQLKANNDHRLRKIQVWMKKMAMGMTAMATPTAHPGSGRLDVTSYGTRSNLVLQGSGVSSVLPIVVQGTLCEAGSTLLLEEPDSHLHRAALDGLLRFFGDCAKRGVQVICTTHSFDLLVSMSGRIESGEIPIDSKIFLVKRSAKGATSVTKLDPGVFRNLRETIKKELAA